MSQQSRNLNNQEKSGPSEVENLQNLKTTDTKLVSITCHNMCVFEFKVPSSAGQQMRRQLQVSSDKLEKLGVELAIPGLQALLHNNAF